MDLNSLTIGQAKELAAMFGAILGATQSTTFTPHIDKYCIVRTYASGVFFGRVVKQDGRMVEIEDCRRMWSWKALEGITLSAVAVNGVDKTECSFPVATPMQTVLDALEIIPASQAAIDSINAVPAASAK